MKEVKVDNVEEYYKLKLKKKKKRNVFYNSDSDEEK